MKQFVAVLEADPFGLEEQGLVPVLTFNHEGSRYEPNFQELNIELNYFNRRRKNPDYQLTMMFSDEENEPCAKFVRCFNYTDNKLTGFGRKALALMSDLVLSNSYDEMTGEATQDGVYAWPRMGAYVDRKTITEIGRSLGDKGEEKILAHPMFGQGLWGNLLRDPEHGFALAHAMNKYQRALEQERIQLYWDCPALQKARDTIYAEGGPFSAAVQPEYPQGHAGQSLARLES